MNNDQNNSYNQKMWQRVALIAGLFGIVISILVIANYFQLNRFDPVNTEIINSLVDRLNENPNDEQLRNQIREVDLLARKAYFTNQWQIKTGGYLLLIAIALIVVSYQMIDLNRRKQVIPNPDNSLDFFGIQKRAQKGVMIAGTVIFLLAGLLMVLTNRQLDNRFNGKLAKSDAKKEAVYNEVVELENDTTHLDAKIVEVEEAEIENIDQTTEGEIDLEKEETLTLSDKPIANEEPVVKETPKLNTLSFDSFKQNFTSFRGFNGLGISYQKNVPTTWDGASGENILWKSKIPVHGYNSPIIWDDKLFLTGANDNIKEVYCYNRTTGDLLWQKAISGIEGSPATAPKTTSDTGLAASTMATDGENVFAIFATGDVVALTMDGDLVWGVNLGVPQNHYGHSSSLLTFKDKLIVQYDQKKGSKVMALDCATGKTVWTTPRQVKVSWSSPSIINIDSKPEIILVADPFVASYNPETGAENWKIDCIFGEVGPSIAYDDGMVFALNEYATLAAIKIGSTPEVLWEGDMYLSDVPSPIAANGLLLVATSYGAVVCHDAKTGDIYWEQEFGNNIYASPILVGDNVYMLDMKGKMQIFKMSKTFEKIGVPALGESSVCTPAFADGHIYIRAGDNLYAIGK